MPATICCRRKALRLTEANKAKFEAQRAQLEAQNLQRREEAEAVSKRMGNLSVVILRQAAEGGALYGSVSARDIADVVKAAGYTVGRSQVQLDHPIKTVGAYPVRVALHPEVSVTVSVNVARSQEEADRAIAASEVFEKAPEELAAGEAPSEPEAEAPAPKAAKAKAEPEAEAEAEPKPKKAKGKKAKDEDEE